MDIELIKKLRNETGLSVTECKKALVESNGDMDEARKLLSKKASAILEKKSDRDLSAGTVQAYIHSNKEIGAMIELLSETDFVSRNEEFQRVAYDIAMHISATKPLYKSRDEISESDLSEIKNNLLKDIDSSKDESMKEKILVGKVDSQLKDYVLLEQKYIKDDSKTIQNIIEETAQKFGERVEIGRFSVFSIK